jgi:hypothetical protein
MLANKVPFGLLSENDKELFRKYISSCYVLQVNGGFCAFLSGASINQTHTFRIKLKEGEWYRCNIIGYAGKTRCVKSVGNNNKIFLEPMVCYDGENCNSVSIKKSEIESIRPATQDEIEAVKPKESFVDVEINHNLIHDGDLQIDCPMWETRLRLKNIPFDIPYQGYVLSSYVYEDGSFSRSLNQYENGYTRIKEKATHARFCKVSV